MAWLLVRLKFAQIRNQLSLGRVWLGTVAQIALWILALAVGSAAALLLSQGIGHPSATFDRLTQGVYLAAVAVAALLPLFLSGGNPLLSPAQLDLLPLTDWQKVRGLFAGALCGPASLLVFALGLGALGSADGSAAAAAAAVLAAALLTLQCVAVNQLVRALMAGLASSRRGREIAALCGSLLLLAVIMFARGIQFDAEDLKTLSLSDSLGWLAWVPGANAAAPVPLVAAGTWGAAVGELAAALATAGLLLGCWTWLLKIRLRGRGGGRASARGGEGVTSLYPVGLRWAPHTELWASAAQMTRYYFFRSSKAMQTALGAIVAFGMGAYWAISNEPDIGVAVLAAGLSTFLTVLVMTLNVFGYENGAFSMYLLTGADLRKVLLGKLVPAVMCAGIFAVILSSTAAVRGGDLTYVPAGLGVAVLLALPLAGLGAISSVLNPRDMLGGVSSIRMGHGFLVVWATMSGVIVFLVALGAGSALAFGPLGWPVPVVIALALAIDAAFSAALILVALRRIGSRATLVLAALGDKAF